MQLEKQLNYEILKKNGYEGYILEHAPEKVLQFGEGSFLRAFADYFFDCANERAGWNGKAVLVQPVSRKPAEAFRQQEGLYTLYLQGIEKGEVIRQKRIISVVSRCINAWREFDSVLELARSPQLEIVVSNTTEAGIVYDPASSFDQNPPGSFPAKLTRILFERYRAGLGGLVILSCELIDDNGKVLKEYVKRHIEDWQLGAGFTKWVEEENLFCSTLVDRIVSGGISDPVQKALMAEENGYTDLLADVAEPYGTWIIEGPESLSGRLPFERAGLNVKVVSDVTPYKQRKVRILNGAHTGFAPGAFLAGENGVRGCMENGIIREFVNRMVYEEIIPGLDPGEEAPEAFAASVFDRFSNPFVDHQLLSICLNSTSKWKTRNLPSLKAYREIYGRLPACLTMSLAAYIAFCSCDICAREPDALVCRRQDGYMYRVRDDGRILDFYYRHRADDAQSLTEAVLSSEAMWGCSLTGIPDLAETVSANLALIREKGMMEAFSRCIGKENQL
ncbi:MAG: tagaturonate reductase [Emergencia sp.]